MTREQLLIEQAAVWGERAAAIHEEWKGLLRQALPAGELRQAGLFASEAEEIIENALVNLFYKRALPHGGRKEQALAARLRKLARGALREEYGVLDLAEAYEAVDGWYYRNKPPKAETLEKLEKRRREAREAQEREKAWFLGLKKEGLPVRVANFRMSCKYVLIRVDGKRDRLVEIVNARGEKTSALVSLDSRSLRSATELREWLWNHGNLNWQAGQQEVDALGQDLAHEGAHKDVYQIISYGTHDATGLWFFDDVAFRDDGTQLIPDADGIFWETDAASTYSGYKFKRNGAGQPVGNEDQEFRPPPPLMKPHLELRYTAAEDKFFLEARTNGEPVAEDPAALGCLFTELSQRLWETLGGEVGKPAASDRGYAGFFAIGAMLGYFAAPEIFRQQSAFPGLWIVGEQQSGKNTLAALLVRLCGFAQKGCNRSLPTTSVVGMQISGEQFSNLPVWFDEYEDHVIDGHKKEVIHESFNRGMPGKWSPTGQVRKARTAFLITGETTASRGATRGRFPHIEMAKENRRGEHLAWLQAHEDLFFTLGRYCLRHRREFAQKVMEHLERWRRLPELGRVEERARLVNGVGYAAFVALSEMLGAHSPAALQAFLQAHVAHTAKAAGEVREQVNVNEFWKDLYNAWVGGAFGHGPGDWKKYFKVVMRDSKTHTPGFPNQTEYGGWMTWHFYFTPGPVIEAMRAHKRKQGRDVPLMQNDLLAQMKTRRYWVEFPRYSGRSEPHKQKFGGSQTGSSCWCINLDEHEMGLQTLPDEEWRKACIKNPDTGDFFPSDEFIDPRKGDLFKIVEGLRRNEEGTL